MQHYESEVVGLLPNCLREEAARLCMSNGGTSATSTFTSAGSRFEGLLIRSPDKLVLSTLSTAPIVLRVIRLPDSLGQYRCFQTCREAPFILTCTGSKIRISFSARASWEPPMIRRAVSRVCRTSTMSRHITAGMHHSPRVMRGGMTSRQLCKSWRSTTER